MTHPGLVREQLDSCAKRLVGVLAAVQDAVESL
jgi:hypothetical protein